MRGHVTKRGSTWTVVYDEGRDERGKRRQRSRGGFATRKEAQAFLTDALSKMVAGSYAAPSKTTVGEFMLEWLGIVEPTLRPLSHTTYAGVVRLRIIPRLGHLRLQELNAGHVVAFHRELEEAGLSAATRRLAHAVLSRALRDGVRWGWLSRNPASLADPPALPVHRRRPGRRRSSVGSSST